MTTVQLSNDKIMWVLESYSQHHDMKEVGAALVFYGWLTKTRNDTKISYQEVSGCVSEFRSNE